MTAVLSFSETVKVVVTQVGLKHWGGGCIKVAARLDEVKLRLDELVRNSELNELKVIIGDHWRKKSVATTYPIIVGRGRGGQLIPSL